MKQKIFPTTYLLVALILMVLLHLLLPLRKSVFSMWQLIGLIPLAFGIGINLAADKALRVAGTTVKPFQESTTLVTNSVYSFSRHPMYLGFVLVLIGIAILLGSLTPWIVIPIFATLMEVVFIQVEERMLEGKFGEGWLEYKKKVRRWI